MLLSTLLAAGLASAAPVPQGPTCDFAPNAREVVLNTDLGSVTTSCGTTLVRGGIYVFRNVTIPAGVTVRGEGSRPLVILALGNITIDGELSANGGDGARVDTLNAANFPTPGGDPACGGGAGGRGSPNATDRSFRGENGFDPTGLPFFGGEGGILGCVTGCGLGSGGGGGVFATAGDPQYPLAMIPAPPVQVFGRGGFGCLASTLPGGNPGLTPFLDRAVDNDFFGISVDVFAQRFVVGELAGPRGGQGGGGGGDRALACTVGDPLFVQDAKGGGGGAGGGVLAVLAQGVLRIGASGIVRADGGNGGGGEQAGSNNRGGGGGGGAGGMVLLLSTTAIELVAHGGTFTGAGDTSFAVSADGGVGTQGVFGGVAIDGKYPPPPVHVLDQRPIGGMGGMGIVQLYTPLSVSNADGTNTLLDDNVRVFDARGNALIGAQKQAYLGWRGWFDQGTNRFVDDFGRPTNAADGDIRPAPYLLPLF